MTEKKVLYLTNSLTSYRVPILNIIARDLDLTVAYSDGKLPNGIIGFKTIKLSEPKYIGPFIWNNENISKLCDSFDVVVMVGEIHRLKYTWQTLRLKRKSKLIIWTIGVSASYSKHYDEVKKWDGIRDFFYKRADACVFYCDYPVKKNLSRGYKSEKMFVANNTVEVLPPLVEDNLRDSILFIGTLYREKGLQLLLDAYKKAYQINKKIPHLNIVGGGSEFEAIKEWIKTNNLSDRIHLAGPIYDAIEKQKYFNKALACISPLQAGLSVLESFGYGVPYITDANAITGGELFNIINGETGVLLNDASELTKTLIDIAESSGKYVKMGKNARNYYINNRTPEMMAKGVIDAINYTLSH